MPSIQELINQSLLQEQEKRSKRERSGKFSPSLLGRCFRAQIYNRANEPESNPPDERALRIFRCGKLFHDFIQGFLPPAQIEVICETDDFKGFADIVTEDSVYDIKSVHSQSFWYSSKPGYDVKKEKYHNWLQLAYYAWVLNKPKIVLVQISKDDLCINEYVDFMDKWRDDLQHEIDLLKRDWDNFEKAGELPNALPRFNRECAYCSYIDTCKKEEESGHREHPSDITSKNCKKSK